jgi:hypothetical protein
VVFEVNLNQKVIFNARELYFRPTGINRLAFSCAEKDSEKSSSYIVLEKIRFSVDRKVVNVRERNLDLSMELHRSSISKDLCTFYL